MGPTLAKCLLVLAAQIPADDGSSSQPKPGDASGQLVDQVVALVGGQVITLSELVAETGLVLLDTRGPRVALEAGLPRSVLRSVLRSMVDTAVVQTEVRRLQLRPLESEAAEQEVRRLLDLFSSDSDRTQFMLNYGFDPAAELPPLMVQRVRARLGADRFIELRLRLQFDVDEKALRDCYEANRDRFVGRSFAQAEPVIRERMRSQLESRALRRLLDRLEAETEIRYAPGFRPLPRAEPKRLWSCRLP